MAVDVDLSPLSTLTSLTINDACMDAATVNSIPSLIQLRSLDLQDTAVREYPDDDVLEGFFPDLADNLEQLTSLNLSSCRWVSSFHLPELCELESLKRLDLRGTPLMARDVVLLGEELPVTSCTVSSCWPECVDQLVHWIRAGVANRIECLELSQGLGLTSAQTLQVLSAIASAGPQLQSLAVSSFADIAPHMAHVAGLSQLTSLSVDWCLSNDTAICQLTALTGLKVLSIAGKITAEGQGYMSELAGSLKQLTKLRVCDAAAARAAKKAFKSRTVQCNERVGWSTCELTLRAVH